jgi:hypothetical protein
LLCLKAHWQFDSDIVYPYCDALETKLNEERPIASVNREKETVAIIEFDVRLFIIYRNVRNLFLLLTFFDDDDYKY